MIEVSSCMNLLLGEVKRGKVKLATGAETVKHVLSTLDTAHCFVESLFDGIDFSSNVTRARFDNQLSKFMSDILAHHLC